MSQPDLPPNRASAMTSVFISCCLLA